MMKSWADHCSSDEDTDDNYSVESEDVQEEQQSLEETFEDKVTIEEPAARTYDFPSRPPFTAFVGNLSYDIQEPSQLQQALADVVFDRLGERVNVLGGRISYDRNSNNKKHRGFGYVELETLDELKTVMKLNDDGQAMLAGRKVQVDTANHQNNRQNNNNRRGNNNQRGSFQQAPQEKIDGSKFRGGRFNQNNNFRNKSKDDAPRERPSLKLAPRSKPIDSDRSSSSNIFGGAKARDEQAWEKNRQQQAEEKKKILLKKNADDNNGAKKDNKSDQEKRQNGRGRGGKGGRGNRGGGRGDQNRKGSGRRNSQNDKKQDKKQGEEKPTAKPNNKPADSAPEPKPDKAAPKNKFALLMDDSDSD